MARREFDHIGMTTTEQQPGEMYVEATKVWVTDPKASLQHVEYLRYEPDSPVTGPLRELPHVAFRVDRLEDHIEGEQVILGPFHATETLRVVFIFKEGLVWEFMEGAAEGDWHTARETEEVGER
jgi:hypothetical protein